ncbi:ATP-dependent permease, partial [Elasticomyces elasticus]
MPTDQKDIESTLDESPATATGDETSQPAPWKALFYFTTHSNLLPLISGIFFAIATGLISPTNSFLLGKIFDGFASLGSGKLTIDEFWKTELRYIYGTLAVGGASWLLHSLFFTSWLIFGELNAKNARDRLFKGLLAKDIEWYDMRLNGIGAMLPRLQVQIRDLQLATSQPLGSMLCQFAAGASSLGLAMAYSWKLTLVILSTAPLIAGAIVLIGGTIQNNMTKQQQKLTEALKYVISALTSIETVKCFNAQDLEVFKYAASIKQAAASYFRVANANAQQIGFVHLASLSMFVQGFWYGTVLVDNGTLNSGQVVTCFWSAIGAFQAIQGVLPQLIVLEKGRAAGATLREVMNQVETGSRTVRDIGLKPEACVGSIEVRNVSFAYPARPDQLALNAVNLSIPSGEITFLIGKSGSGKSTLGQLLMRFYSPSLGNIALDEKDVQSLDATWLREKVTLVEQHSTLFNDTIFRNVAFGRRDYRNVSREEVTDAIEFALLKLMINDIPEGLDTMVGARGDSLSGGQKQRIALARARLRDTPILLLDESTSALDPVSKALMMDAIREWRRGKTTIIITHDISQILPDDYAYVLQGGRLVQEGYRKQMEAIIDSPFQDFLVEDEQATVSPSDSQKHLSFDKRRTQQSPKTSRAAKWSPKVAFDPLEARLDAGEKKRASRISAVFPNASSSPALRMPYRLGGIVSPFASPLMPLISPSSLSPASDRSSGTFGRPLSVEVKRQSGYRHSDYVNKRSSRMGNRWSLPVPDFMEKFIEKSGMLAAEYRLGEGRSRRRRQLSEDAVPSAEKPRPSKKWWKMRRTAALALLQDETPQLESIKNILATIWPCLLWHTRVVLVLGFVGAAVHAAATPLFSYVLSKLLNTFANPTNRKQVAKICSIGILGIAVTDSIGSYVMHILLEYVGQVWVNEIRLQALKRVLDQPRDFFTHDENNVSHLTECLDRHAEEMRNLLGRFSALVFTAIIMMVTAIVWAMVTSWKLTLLSLVVAPYIFVVTKAFAAVSGKWETASNNAGEAATAIFTETFTNIKTVRALTLERVFEEKYNEATLNALKIGIKRSLYVGLFFGLADSADSFATAIIFYFAAMLSKQGGITIAKILETFTMLLFTMANVSAILAFIPQMSSSRDTASRILRLARLPEDSHEHAGNTCITSIGDITFTNLTFSYPSRPDHVTLKNINLTIRAGTCTAIVGSSGSGKSTIASLLLNLYPTATQSTTLGATPDLTLANRDMKHIHTPTLRSLISIVPQTPVLFAAMVADNISYGLHADSAYKSLSNIRRAAKQAGIDDFIMSLPSGYSSLVGEGGMGLSGGQSQRIAIARALVREPSVLILDEATSALDVESAALIRQTVQELMMTMTGKEEGRKKMTVIIITHSRDMMAIAERIVVLDQGSVVEE